MEHIGAVIAAEMAAQGLSQRTVADRTGIPLVTLNRSLKGRRPIRSDEMSAIAAVLGLKVSVLTERAESLHAA